VNRSDAQLGNGGLRMCGSSRQVLRAFGFFEQNRFDLFI
jgi:hypothetical protein